MMGPYLFYHNCVPGTHNLLESDRFSIGFVVMFVRLIKYLLR